jgi:hypothetical protein
MKLSLLLIAMFSLLTACSNGVTFMKTEVDVVILNKSTHDLENARVYFGEIVCKWGFVGRSFSASRGLFPHPITETAKLKWDEEGSSRVEDLDISKIYNRKKHGILKFIVYDDRVEVTFVEREKF